MARKPNSVKTVQIRISTNPRIQEYLERLVDTGLYGKNPAEAADRLIASGIEQILREGILLNPNNQGSN